MARFLRFETICFFVVFAILMGFGRERFYGDPGTFWHIKTGRIILETGQFLTVDPYSFTYGGKPWTPYEWLAEVTMELLYRWGGLDSLLVVSIASVSLLFAALAGRIRQSGLHPIAVSLLCILAVGTASNHFHVRPHLFTMLGMAATMVALAAVESGRKSIRFLGWLVPGYIAWVNVHGGVLGGIATVGMTFALWLAMALLRWNSPVKSWRDALELSIIGIAILATPIVSPYGLEIPKTWFAIMGMPELKELVKEHMPINVGSAANYPFFAFAAVYAFMLAGLREKPRATWLIPIVWFVMGLDRVRHISLFGIVAFAAMADVFPRTIYAQWLAAKRPDYIVPPRTAPTLAAWILPILLIAFSFALHRASISVPLLGRGWAQFNSQTWPMELLPVIRAEAEGHIAEPIFNDYDDGGFLIWYTPEFRPFIDDRCEVYGGKWIKRFCDASRGGRDTAKVYFDDQEAYYGPFKYALLQTDTGYDMYLQSIPETWECLGRTEKHSFYRRIPGHSTK